MFTGIERAKFRRPVMPGDQLRFEIEVLKVRSRPGKHAGPRHGGRQAGLRGDANVPDGAKRQGTRERGNKGTRNRGRGVARAAETAE